jgi:hypothetical protein
MNLTFMPAAMRRGAVNVDNEQSARLAASKSNIQVITRAPPRVNSVKIKRGIVCAAATGGFFAALLARKDGQAALRITDGVWVKGHCASSG